MDLILGDYPDPGDPRDPDRDPDIVPGKSSIPLLIWPVSCNYQMLATVSCLCSDFCQHRSIVNIGQVLIKVTFKFGHILTLRRPNLLRGPRARFARSGENGEGEVRSL